MNATCAWCRRTVPLGQAIDEGWFPEWWDQSGVCHSRPTCPVCAAKHLQEDESGEMGLRPGHPLPEEQP